jgi:anti-anti-sigma factor
MKIAVHRREPWTVLALEGDLDLDSGPGVYLQFQRELLQGHTQFVIDMGGVDIVDSSGLGVLVRCYRDARSRGGEVALQEVREPVRRILEFTRLDSIFRILPLAADTNANATAGAGTGAGDPPADVRLEAA